MNDILPPTQEELDSIKTLFNIFSIDNVTVSIKVNRSNFSLTDFYRIKTYTFPIYLTRKSSTTTADIQALLAEKTGFSHGLITDLSTEEKLDRTIPSECTDYIEIQRFYLAVVSEEESRSILDCFKANLDIFIDESW